MEKRIRLLDATLRNGGQGLDDQSNNGFSDRFYLEETKHKIIDPSGRIFCDSKFCAVPDGCLFVLNAKGKEYYKIIICFLLYILFYKTKRYN